PVEIGLAVRPLAEAATYGVLTAALFALWPLARTREVKAAALFRDLGPGRRVWPGWRLSAVLAGIAGTLVAVAVGVSGVPELAFGTLGGIVAALVVLTLAALALRWFARRMGHRARGRPALRLALSAIGSPKEEATAVILSLGLGLSVLAAVGQIDTNLRASIDRDLPGRVEGRPAGVAGRHRAEAQGGADGDHAPRRARGGGRPLGRPRRPGAHLFGPAARADGDRCGRMVAGGLRRAAAPVLRPR